MIRLALAGCGEHSRSSHATPLARYVAQHPGQVELVAACDLVLERAEEFCRRFGFGHPYTDLDRMLTMEQLDGCVSVMPIEQIVEVGVRLLQYQLPCVIEKPLGISLAQTEHLARTAQQTQTPHMVSVNRRFMPFLNTARDWANSLGPLQYLRATQIRDARSEPDFIWSTAIHVLDALRYIAGEISDFRVETQQHSALTSTWYSISLRFDSGTKGQIEVLPTAGMVEESYELFGDGFRSRVTAGTGTQQTLECWQRGKKVLHEISFDDEPEDLRNGSYQEVEEFVGALKSGNRPHPEIKDILPSARICFAIAESLSHKF
ncbi:MAG: Gfo/Idh/MocA family protein [Pyrinomonadaceae bacterium]